MLEKKLKNQEGSKNKDMRIMNDRKIRIYKTDNNEIKMESLSWKIDYEFIL